MTDRRPRHSLANQLAFGPVLGLGLAASLTLGACGPSTPMPSNNPQASVALVEPSADGPSSARTSNAAPPAGQTDTDWGRIWDSLPAAFPVYPGATPAKEAETGPVSATFALQAQDAKTVAAWMQAELERTEYGTEALTGPLEDGSFVVESIGTAGCRVEVAVAPLGGLLTVTVRYGAACPSD